MEAWGKVVIAIVIAVIVRWGWKLVNWVWLKPKKLEKWLRDEGYKGNSYNLLTGDINEFATMVNEARSKHLPITHDITSYILPFDHHIITKYGKKSFLWVGPNPRIYIWDPDLIKEILSKPNDFPKPHPKPFRDSFIGGLLVSEGHKWIKHRKIINPAFHLQNLKIMFPAICSSCSDMVQKWELLTAATGSTEVDVWPYVDNLAGDVISRTAFGSCYEKGKKIFGIQKEQIDLVFQMLFLLFVPGRRFIPTSANKKFNKNHKEMQSVLKDIIDKRKKEIKMGPEGGCDDLLGILLESNSKEIEEDGAGMSMDDVIEECKLFYIAGSETTSNLIVWTMVCLSLHQEWQTQARQEILQVFGTGKLDFEGLKHLKILTMILNEVLRLYPPVVMVIRATTKETRLGNMMIPSGVYITLPIIHIHHDHEIWGGDAAEFNPKRFSEGVSNATKGKGSAFFPFTSGPRVCIGQNFAMAEAKAAIATILQRFSCELSPSYKHSPFPVFTLPPQFGAHLILSRIS
ncbi:cytochrome P450 CYP72A219-like [Cynara cardunculus var. scolymus]|nr:cytochrome P450 CYP72A219-like [Cynara cardunculus var. scolymus]